MCIALCEPLTRTLRRSFAAKLAAARPFDSVAALHAAAARIWSEEARASNSKQHAGFLDPFADTPLMPQVPVPGWLEAFAAHPRIGDVSGLRAKFASTAAWCEGEQSTALASADESVLQARLWRSLKTRQTNTQPVTT